MRPQRNAAENLKLAERPAGAAHASMRPQRNAAENDAMTAALGAALKASMRPQRNAAENLPPGWIAGSPIIRFNEAAA